MSPTPEVDAWAEGIAVIGDSLIQLTWKHHKAFVYNLSNFEHIGEINYDGDGWGLTSCPGGFVMSDGSNRLTFRSEDFRVQRNINVAMRGIPVTRLNDLEYVDGSIYANVLYSNEIFQISALTGKIQAICDCREIVRLEQPLTTEAVLNGIAFNPVNKTFFITGKYWSRMFEIEFVPSA
jgi:glutamine cyclotransferase